MRYDADSILVRCKFVDVFHFSIKMNACWLCFKAKKKTANKFIEWLCRCFSKICWNHLLEKCFNLNIFNDKYKFYSFLKYVESVVGTKSMWKWFNMFESCCFSFTKTTNWAFQHILYIIFKVFFISSLIFVSHGCKCAEHLFFSR